LAGLAVEREDKRDGIRSRYCNSSTDSSKGFIVYYGIREYAVVYLLLYQLQQALLVGAAEVVDGGEVSSRVR